jgi:hypothetical protein
VAAAHPHIRHPLPCIRRILRLASTHKPPKLPIIYPPLPTLPIQTPIKNRHCPSGPRLSSPSGFITLRPPPLPVFRQTLAPQADETYIGRITTFACNETEVKVIDPNKPDVIEAVGCKVREVCV